MYAVEGGKGAEIALVLEGEFDGGDLGGIAVGEVGDVAFFDFAVLAEGFAEVDGLVGFTVGGGPACASYVHVHTIKQYSPCLLYTSDAADDLLCVDLGGRRIIKKKNIK